MSRAGTGTKSTGSLPAIPAGKLQHKHQAAAGSKDDRALSGRKSPEKEKSPPKPSGTKSPALTRQSALALLSRVISGDLSPSDQSAWSEMCSRAQCQKMVEKLTRDDVAEQVRHPFFDGLMGGVLNFKIVKVTQLLRFLCESYVRGCDDNALR